MNATKNTLPAATRERAAKMLNARVADALVLYSHAKHAHWNVRGPSFIALHELFDDVADAADEYGDLLAERAIMLGGVVHGAAHDAVANTALPKYTAVKPAWREHVDQLSSSLAAFGEQLVKDIATAEEINDPDTADVLTEVSRGVDKFLWFVEAHLAE